MRFFALLDLQNATLAFFLGLAALVVLYVAFRGYGPSAGEGHSAEPEQYPEGIRIGHGPLPPILLFVYVGFALWALAYVIVVGIMGPPF